MEQWEAAIKTLGSYAYDHLYCTDPWFKQLSEQMVEIAGIIYFLFPEECYAHYLRKWFREIPFPYITVDQLYMVLRCTTAVRRQDKFRRICELYQKHFPEESAYPRPRSLLHLSRCAIRKRLKSNRKLPLGIYELEIPGTLHHYLDLKSAASSAPDPPLQSNDIHRIGRREADWLRRLLDPTLCFVAFGDLYTAEAWFSDVMDRWGDTPQPYLSVGQVRVLLGLYLGRSERAAAVIGAACDHYSASLPSSRLGRTPRSLMHLCRCEVRKVLKGNGLVTVGFEHLGLPRDMVQYLQMKK